MVLALFLGEQMACSVALPGNVSFVLRVPVTQAATWTWARKSASARRPLGPYSALVASDRSRPLDRTRRSKSAKPAHPKMLGPFRSLSSPFLSRTTAVMGGRGSSGAATGPLASMCALLCGSAPPSSDLTVVPEPACVRLRRPGGEWQQVLLCAPANRPLCWALRAVVAGICVRR
jgi:hypothetical protein